MRRRGRSGHDEAGAAPDGARDDARAAAPVRLTVDGAEVAVAAGCTVAAALLNAGTVVFRRSVGGEPRAPLCGMGICFECRVTIDGVPHQRACLVVARTAMVVTTDG